MLVEFEKPEVQHARERKPAAVFRQRAAGNSEVKLCLVSDDLMAGDKRSDARNHSALQLELLLGLKFYYFSDFDEMRQNGATKVPF